MPTETPELLLNKLPPKVRGACRVTDIQHSLIACVKLTDQGCTVDLHNYGFKIEIEDAVLYKGLRGKINRLLRINLESDITNKIIPITDLAEYDGSSEMVLGADAKIKWSVNSIHERVNTNQLIKYYHSSPGSYPKQTLIQAGKVGCLRGFKGLTAKQISRSIGAEHATEAGHMGALTKVLDLLQ